MYAIENYKNTIRFNEQYAEIHNFLQIAADSGCNEHFHWGRFAWMMAHSWLDVEMLPKNALFRDESGALVGAVLYDTGFQDRWYILHSVSDRAILEQMVDYAVKSDGGGAAIKANLNDAALCGLLERAGFEKRRSGSVLKMELSRDLPFRLPQGFHLNAPDAGIDQWQWRLVIYHGFDHRGIPDEPDVEVAEAEKHLEIPEYIKVFAIRDAEYAAHCGMWYGGGDTAYIEPVVTVPEHRGKGLGRAVVYEAMNRAKKRGAKRAIVLSDQQFYFRIGMEKSSEVAVWAKSGR